MTLPSPSTRREAFTRASRSTGEDVDHPLAIDLCSGLGKGTGRMLDKRGYVLTMAKGHPRANRDGYVWEHLLVAERALGKHLSSPRVIHHFDETHDNNEPANLVICPDQGYHKLLHQRADALRACGDASALKCNICHSYARQDEMRVYMNRGVGRCGRHLSCNRAHVRLSTKATKRPLAIDLFCGLSGWGEGLIAEGFDVVGYDIEDMFATLNKPKPEHFHLVIRDVATIHGAQFRNADLIVASPPCQAYSWMAMPWTLAKTKAAAILADTTGAEMERLNRLFNACFRIQREACEAARRHIPMIVENVRGAQKWVGRARWKFGSFYLWGDVPALMPHTKIIPKRAMDDLKYGQRKLAHAHLPVGSGPLGRNAPREGAKLPGFRFDGSGKSFQTASVEGVKNKDADGYERNHPQAFGWKSPRTSSGTVSKRKEASALIAKIPLTLSRHIGRTFHPSRQTQSGGGRDWF